VGLYYSNVFSYYHASGNDFAETGPLKCGPRDRVCLSLNLGGNRSLDLFIVQYTPENFKTSAQTNEVNLKVVLPVEPLPFLPFKQLVRSTFKCRLSPFRKVVTRR
jgi:hypothetical protein